MKWDEIINEGRDAPLYHGTSTDTAISILQADSISAMTQHDALAVGRSAPVFGVSLTRDIRTALDIGQVCFEVSQTKLTQNRKLIPIDFTPFNPSHTWSVHNPRSSALTKRAQGSNPHGDRFEHEEFCVGAIAPLNRYLVAIHVIRKHLSQIERKYGRQAAILLDHPLLKIVGSF
jgi:hypothetical protein